MERGDVLAGRIEVRDGLARINGRVCYARERRAVAIVQGHPRTRSADCTAARGEGRIGDAEGEELSLGERARVGIFGVEITRAVLGNETEQRAREILVA